MNDLNSPNQIAADWIKTDPQACREDVQRLGLDGAADYNMALITEAIIRNGKVGQHYGIENKSAWEGITLAAMREELAKL